MPEQPSKDLAMTEAFAPRRSAPLILGAGAFGLVLAATMLLWAHYGTAVFFEMIRAGLVACFG